MAKQGDVVVLKSGGPKMTVNRIIGQDSVECAWFTGAELKTGLFSPTALTAAT